MAVADYFDTVQKVYIAFYQRPADPAGLYYWSQRVDAKNGNLSAVIDAFANSAEATRLFFPTAAEGETLYDLLTEENIGGVIDAIYLALFNRAPDEAGKQFYVDGFADGTFTAGNIMLNILNGAQGDDAVAVANKLEVASLFTTALDPEQDGIGPFQATYNAADEQVARDWLATVTSDPATRKTESQVVTDIQTAIADSGDAILGRTAGQTFTLTNNADAPVGTAGNDTFVATEASLSSADVLDGGAGIDTLRYASSGAAAVNEAGFEASNIETVQVTSDATFGTTFDVTGVTELQTLRNFNSSEDLTLVGMDRLVAVELQSVGSAGAGANDPTPDTTLTFNAAVVAGNADALSVKLNGNLNVDGSGVGDLNVAGIEIVNVTTEGAASSMNSIASGSLRAMTIAGDQNLTLAAASFFDAVNVNTVNASAFTGNLNLTLTNDNALGIDVAVTGGTGNDTVTFQSFDTNDAFNGGDGTDTIGMTNAVATARTTTNGGTLSNVEQLNITTLGTGVIDMDAFPGVSKVIYDAGLTNGVLSTVSDAVSGITVEVDTLAGGTGNLTVALKTDGTADVVTIELDGIAAGHSVGTLTAADAETLNISADDDTVAGNGAVTIANLALTDTTALNLSGDADLTIAAATNPATPVLATVNASAATGNLNITGLNTAAAGATITLGSGDDRFNVATSNGADTITLGLGRDTIVYNAVAQSDRDMDTITDFVSGTDIVDVRALMGGIGIASSVQFVGNRATFGQAQGALDNTQISAVFQQDEGILWIDANNDGTLDNTDFRVKLNGVTAITAADLGFTAGVAFTANQAAFNTATAAHSQEGNAVGTEDDTINATVAQINDAATVINGLGGTDVLNVSATAANAEIATLDLTAGQFLNVETINLANTVEGVRLDDGDIATVTRLAGAAGKTQSLEVATADLTGMTISNIETLIVNTDATIDEDNFASFATITGDGSAILQLTGNAATDDFDFSAVTMTGISTLTLNTVDIVTLDAADLAAVTTINGAAGAAIVANGTVDVSGIAVTDAAVRSIAVAGNLTIDNGTDGDEFETITGTSGGRTLIIAAGGATAIADLTGFSNINATALADGDVVTLDDDLTDGAVTIAIGDSDLNVTGASTDDLTVNALGGVANQAITTAGGDDTVNIDVGATAAAVATGDGDDIINAGALLTVADTIDGGDGDDVLNVTDDNATTDLDGVTNVETINIVNTGTSSYQPADTVVAAGESITVDASNSVAAVTMDFSLETDGQVNYVASANGDAITFAGNTLVDTYILGAGVDVITLDAGNTIANLANVDVITGFKAAGADTLDSGTAHAAGLTYTVNLASTTIAGFVGDVNAGLASLVGYAAAATDVVVVNVAGGDMAGTYVVQDLLGDSITADDFVVELVGAGIITAADFV